MNVTVQKITSFCNGSVAKNKVSSRFKYGRALALGASVALLCGNGAALAGPCTMQIVQFERQIADNMTDPMSSPILPQSLHAQLHHQPTLETVVQAQHVRNTDGNAVIDLARKADNDGNIRECIRALIEARRLFDLGD
jgi:hypothetical protein